MTNNYTTQENGRVPIIMNWLGQEWLRSMQIMNDEEQEKCRTSTRLFIVLRDKFRPQHNKTVLSLQHFKLASEQNENAKNALVAPE